MMHSFKELAGVYWHVFLATAKNICRHLHENKSEAVFHTSTITSTRRENEQTICPCLYDSFITDMAGWRRESHFQTEPFDKESAA